jgi:hypothetical protein
MTSLAKSMTYYNEHIEQIKLNAQNGNLAATCVLDLVAVAIHSGHNKNIVHLFTESMSAYIKLEAEVKAASSINPTEEINEVAFAVEPSTPVNPKKLDISKMF